MNLMVTKEASEIRNNLSTLISAPNAFNVPIHFTVVTNVRERMLLLANEMEQSDNAISKQLMMIRDSMFLEQRINWTTSVFLANPVSFGAAIALLDIFVAKGQESEDDIWRFIHPAICKSSKRLYNSGNYANSAVDAFIEVVDCVKKAFLLINPDATEIPDGADLMHKMFTEKSPILPVCKLDSRSGEDTQKGYHFMMAGAVSALRNPKSHSNAEQVTGEDAMRRLMFASMLMYKIDDAISLLNIHEE